MQEPGYTAHKEHGGTAHTPPCAVPVRAVGRSGRCGNFKPFARLRYMFPVACVENQCSLCTRQQKDVSFICLAFVHVYWHTVAYCLCPIGPSPSSSGTNLNMAAGP